MLISMDHVALVVRDLKASTERYSAFLGCKPIWRGTERARFQLGNTALDMVVPVGSSAVGVRAQGQLDKHGEGLWVLAFATADIGKARHTLARRGIASSEVRQIRSADFESNKEYCWATSELSAEATHGITIFLVEQETDAAHGSRCKPNAAANSAVSSLDHIVITTAHPERAAALYGTRLGLEMKLDRTNPDWGSRLMFFKCGDLVVEIAHNLKNIDSSAPDKLWGLSWRVADIAAAHARIAQAGFNVSDIRVGRKPGTKVFTVRDAPANVPTLVIGRD